MKRVLNKVLLMILSAIMILAAFSSSASAEINIDTKYPVTLHIRNENFGTKLEGAEFRIYKIAAYHDDGTCTLMDTFKGYPISLENIASNSTLAETISSYITRDVIAPDDTGRTDSEGSLIFPTSSEKMTAGIYLLVSNPLKIGESSFESTPELVSVPYEDKESNTVAYDVTVMPKTMRLSNVTAPVERSVIKQWQGDNAQKRPNSITVFLYCNGTKYDSIDLSEENNWQYTWKNLHRLSDDGTVNQWSVAEKEVPGYATEIESEGTVFIVTNSLISTETTSAIKTISYTKILPQTGQLWWPVPVLILAGVVCLLLGRNRKSY